MTIHLTGFSDEICSDFARQLEVSRRLGVKAIEIRTVNGKNISTLTLEEAAQVRKQLDAQGMTVSAIGSPLGKIDIQDDFDPHFALTRHVVEIAKILGSRFIRMFSFYVPKDTCDIWQDEVLRRLRMMVSYAAEHDVVLLHENEKGIFGDNARRCKLLMDELAGDHFHAVFDFANFVQCGQDTLEAWAQLKPYVRYVHIKDALNRDGTVVPAGWGDGHVKAILFDLLDGGYDGYLSLEPHLGSFVGFAALERNAAAKAQTDGEVAYHIALDALKSLLWDYAHQ